MILTRAMSILGLLSTYCELFTDVFRQRDANFPFYSLKLTFNFPAPFLNWLYIILYPTLPALCTPMGHPKKVR